MAINAFLNFFDSAKGEATLRGKESWVEVVRWQWGVANTSVVGGSGATAGKPQPATFNWEHYYDTSSSAIMGFVCSGKALPKVELQVVKLSDAPQTYFTMSMQGVFITKAGIGSNEAGAVVQTVEMVFKSVAIEYRPMDARGMLGAAKKFSWDLTTGAVSP
jgi:type VI protein secretion system component Hcp